VGVGLPLRHPRCARRRRDLRELLLGVFPEGLGLSPAAPPTEIAPFGRMRGPAAYSVLGEPAEPALPYLRRDPNGNWRALEREVMVELVLVRESIRGQRS
jgi:hypothetical protein